MAVSFLFSLGLAEFLLRLTEDGRVWKRRYLQDHALIQQPAYRYDPRVLVRFRPYWQGKSFYSGGAEYVRLHINSHGFRFPEYSLGTPPETKRIALIGDSLVAAVQVEAESHFRSLAEDALSKRVSTEILSFGIPGCGPVSHLNLYRHYVQRFQPDVVVLGIYTGNDFTDDPDVRWKDARGKLVDEPFASAGGDLGKYLKANSCLVMLGWAALRKPQLVAQEQQHIRHVSVDQTTAGGFEALASHELAGVSPRLFESMLGVWDELLRLCHQNGQKTIVILFPEQGNTYSDSPNRVYLRKSTLQTRLAEHFRNLGCETITWTEMLPAHAERFPSCPWAKHLDYLSESGHEILGEILAEECAKLFDSMDHKFRKQINELNSYLPELLRDMENVTLLDIGPKLLDENGFLPKEIMPDTTHPSKKGYEIWAKAIEPELQKMLGQ
jgi:hypothetical protein